MALLRKASDMANRMTSPASGTKPRLHLPREHGSVLCSPELDTASEWIDLNHAMLSTEPCDVQGMPLLRLRDWTRDALLDEAVRFTSSMWNDDASSGMSRGPADTFVVTGHQPDLFHAGVWAKNFAAAALARRHDAVALNLIVDNDSLESVRLRVPVGPRSIPHIERIAFDSDRSAQPWEEAAIVDHDLFRSFGARVSAILRENWSFAPLIDSCWSAAVRQSETTNRLCNCLTAVRVSVERELGFKSLELPMSRVCDSAPFRQFASHLLAHLPRVHSLYNAAVREYRHEHRLRSTSHPVPELASRDDWLEAPFWVWRAGDLHRDRPFVRRVGSQLELRDSRELLARWTQTEDGSAEATIATLANLARQGLRFRTRALTTTLFTRLCLADLFIHGIGGAKYDAMTDRLCEQLFGLTAPRFATVSATFHLPLGTASHVEGLTEQQLVHQLRDLRFNPDRHITVASGSLDAALIEEKRRLIASLASRRPTALETRRIEQLNALLTPSTHEQCESWQSDRETLRQRHAIESIQQDREFSWCLHPREELAATFLAAFRHQSPAGGSLHGVGNEAVQHSPTCEDFVKIRGGRGQIGGDTEDDRNLIDCADSPGE